MTFTEPQATPPQTSEAPARITITEGANNELTVSIPNDDGTSSCELRATRSGQRATITPGQTCEQVRGGATLRLSVREGTLTFQDSSLTMDLNWDVSLSMQQRRRTITRSGTSTFHVTAQRQP